MARGPPRARRPAAASKPYAAPVACSGAAASFPLAVALLFRSRPPVTPFRLSALALLAATSLTSVASAEALTPAGKATAHVAAWPVVKSPAALTDAATEAKITALMARMSVREKVGQTIQADIGSIRPEQLREYPLGSILAGGSSGPNGDDKAGPKEWAEFVDLFRAVSLETRDGHVPIPLMFGIDAVHGHNNVVGATLFPHNVGLGAARDPDLIERIGKATAEEVAVAGGDWTFGPTVAVPRDDRWGRAYEGYGEDPEIVRSYAGRMTLGLQGKLTAGKALEAGRIAGSAKHFLADGGTLNGKDQGDAPVSEADLVRLHAQGYPPSIEAGILTVMASFSSWNGVKHTGNKTLLTNVLKDRMGFTGFVVGDWNAHGQVDGCSNVSCPQALNAGLDMYMAPDSWQGLFDNTLQQVQSGEISMARLDDAVRRILRVKVKSGLFDRVAPPVQGRYERVGAPDHRALAREAVAKSLVLLKNDGVLPIKAGAKVLVAGDADDIGKAAGGWTLSWQGTGNTNADFPGAQSIWRGLKEAVEASGGKATLSRDGAFTDKPDVAVVVFGETPYAEFQGDLQHLEYQPGDKTDLALLKKLKAAGVPVVAVFLSGRPLWVNPEINASDAFVAAWLPGSEGGGVADVLVAGKDGKSRRDFTGKLSFSWPKRADQGPLNKGDAGYDPQFAYGYGLSYAKPGKVATLGEVSGVSGAGVNVDKYFISGRTPAPWLLSTAGGVKLTAIDAAAQEDARLATWTGPGALLVNGPPADLTRQTTGDLSIAFTYRVDERAPGPVGFSVSCGEGCAGGVDVTKIFADAPVGEWRKTQIKLSCLKAAGADMSRISSPVVLSAQAGFKLAFSEIRLEPTEAHVGCPGS
ncbi:1,4-beta-D-glucan glucohydrolase [Caulobacter zeae]|uniref:1,4-beta-D-glucan glucohydrolase n=1 Tax=Caulobacter zeae TaxID=2055137 RepID=A0A2N5D3T2_9CAUL|nr:1,4-beta-D-glucan glucohydrolase [Caulobacter zeae]